MTDALALLGRGPHDDVHKLFAAADLRHGSAVQRGLHETLDVRGGQAQQPCLVLIDVDLHRADLLVPVQLCVTHQRALAHGIAHPVGDLPHLRLVGADDTKLDREAHRRAELETQHAGLDVGKGFVFVEQLHEAGAHAFALFRTRRLDDELCEPRVGQFGLDR